MKTDNPLLKGLTDAEVLQSREQHGHNIFTPAEKEAWWKKFLEKFKDPLIVVLIIAGVLSIAIALYEVFVHGAGIDAFLEPLGIFVAVLLATGLAFIFEHQAEKEFALLNQVNDDEPVDVIRNGAPTRVSRKDIVVGDLVVLNTGAEVPADGELLEAVRLSVDESTLTGEPLCQKSVRPEDFNDHDTFPTNYVLRGTKVMEGNGKFVVKAVGDVTEAGQVYEAAQIDNSVRTPLNDQLEQLGALISKISYGIATLVIVLRVVLYINEQPQIEMLSFLSYLLQSVMIAVSLIVMTVPEGLPMAVTLSLAYSMKRMLKTNNLVRRMHACETMGAVTMICTDKTGTLTQNRMSVAHEKWAKGPEWLTKLIEEGIAANSTAQLEKGESGMVRALGNPTEGALLLMLQKRGLDYQTMRQSIEIIDQEPFNTERKFMRTIVKSNVLEGSQIAYIKGAPEIVLNMCTRMGDGLVREEVEATLRDYQNQAMRTLAFAFERAGETTLLGVVAIADPVRDDVPAAIGECLGAGIGIKIVTGDTPNTAREIARQIGLWKEHDGAANLITGPEFAALSDEEVLERCQAIKIMARARPMDKKRLVEALQTKGEVVAVTGDGTNDAPALKAAQVGLSMGDGTSVAKEASDITIIDNSFASIGRAVMWGRSLYRNIQRFILFQITVNVAACLIMFFGSFFGVKPPLTVVQMLWVNLMMDTFAAMALASLPPTTDVMRQKPRLRTAFIITKDMWKRIFGLGILFFVVLFGVLYVFEMYEVDSLWSLLNGEAVRSEKAEFSLYEGSLFFTLFVMLQYWNMYNARAYFTNGSAFNLKGCKGFIFIVLLILIGQIFIVQYGGVFLSVQPLSLLDWLLIIGSTSLVLLVGEAVRLVKRMG